VFSSTRPRLERLWDLARSIWSSPSLLGILAVYFVQGASGLARLAISFYLKDALGLSPAQVAALTGITVIPWTIKPLYGWLSDSVPLWGYRRRPYLVISGVLGCSAWLLMAVWVQTPWQATAMVTLGSLAGAVGDVIADSLVVERSRSQDWAGTGSLQSLCWGTVAMGSLITAYLGGLLLERYPPEVIFGCTAVLPLLTVWAATRIEDPPQSQTPDRPQGGQLRRVWQAIKQPSLFLPVLFIFLWQSTPSSESAFFFFVTNDLGFGPEFLGRVRLATSIASLIGVFLFQTFLRRMPLRPLLAGMTVISAGLGMTSLILVYHLNRDWGIDDRWFSLGDSVILTVAGQIAFMPILVLAARLCPQGIEATLFALLMSILNLAGGLSHELGSVLMHGLGVSEQDFSSLGSLVLITNLSSLLPLPFLGWLPADLEQIKPTAEPKSSEESLQDLVTEVRQAEAVTSRSPTGTDLEHPPV